MVRRKKVGRPKKVKGRDTRGSILESALELFASQGYHATSVRQIAERVKVTDAALYSHFKSKRSILEELLDRHGPQSLVKFIRALPIEELSRSPRIVLKQSVPALVDLFAEAHEIMLSKVICMELLQNADASVMDPFSSFLKVESLVKEGLRYLMTQKIVRECELDSLTQCILAPIYTLRLRYFTFGQAVERSVLINSIERHIDFVFDTWGVAASR